MGKMSISLKYNFLLYCLVKGKYKYVPVDKANRFIVEDLFIFNEEKNNCVAFCYDKLVT